jgi:hypothetical protein
MTVETMNEWDQKVAPFLHVIEDNAKAAERHARSIGPAVRMLPYRPGFETLAQEALDRAEQAALNALAQIKEARTRYIGIQAAG